MSNEELSEVMDSVIEEDKALIDDADDDEAWWEDDEALEDGESSDETGE